MSVVVNPINACFWNRLAWSVRKPEHGLLVRGASDMAWLHVNGSPAQKAFFQDSSLVHCFRYAAGG